MCDEKISDGVGGDEPHRWCGRFCAGQNKIPHFHQPENLALRIKRDGAGETRHRYRLTQFDCVTAGQPGLDLGQLLGAVLLLRIRNSDQGDVAFL